MSEYKEIKLVKRPVKGQIDASLFSTEQKQVPMPGEG